MTELICYYCGAPATTTEHVPPRCLFPKERDTPDGINYRKNLITVPSCETHNNSRSQDDQYLLYILSASITSNNVGLNQFLTTVSRAMHRRPAVAHQMGSSAQPVTMHDTVNDQWKEAYAVSVDYARVSSVLEHCARGLYFHHTDRVFSGEAKVLSSFLLIPFEHEVNNQTADAFEVMDRILISEPCLGEQPAVFSYKIIFDEAQCSALLSVEFYGASRFIIRLQGAESP